VKRTIKVIIVWLIIILLLSLQGLNSSYDGSTQTLNEPILSDNLDGNWTALWELKNPSNYTTTRIEFNDGKATLQLNRIKRIENKITQFRNGTYDNVMEYGNFGIGLDLTRDFTTLISDTQNHRVIEVDFNKWLWQYGTNSTPGYTLKKLNKPSFAVRYNDKTLITDSNNNRVIEVGKNNEFYWQYGSNTTAGIGNNLLNDPSSALAMDNGNILIADTGNDYVVEVNRNKKWVWQYGYSGNDPGDWNPGESMLTQPTFAEPLSNGNILITDRGSNIIIEVNKNKFIEWVCDKIRLPGGGWTNLYGPTFAKRLPNGNTLIADTNHHCVIEIDPDLNLLWQYGRRGISGSGFDKLTFPTCAMRLKNGNTLITDTGNHRVIEVNGTNHIIWQYGTNGTYGSGLNYLYAPQAAAPIQRQVLHGAFISQVIDGGKVTNWTNISWKHISPLLTQIYFATRTGNTPSPSTGVWSEWSGAYIDSKGEIITSPNNRYIQYAAVFISLEVDLTPILREVIINGTRYEQSGELITCYLEPSGLIKWVELRSSAELNGQIIEPYYSIREDFPWQKVDRNGDLRNVPIDSGKIKFRFVFTTSNISNTPVLENISLVFERLGKLYEINVIPNSGDLVVGEELDFTAKGYDEYGRELLINPVWSTTVGEIEDGRFISQTKVSTGYVNATENGVVGCAEINLIPGPLDSIVVNPTDIVIIAGDSRLFTATGYDRFNNEVQIKPIWKTDIGVMEDNLLIAQQFGGSGTVKAMVDDTTGFANVSIKLNSSTHHPPKILSRVPNQVKPEDCEPWVLNLAYYEWDDEDTSDKLLWYITDVNKTLYTTTGSYSKNDIITFIPKQNAFGTNKATLWLIDSDNMTTNQPLWINITPINDKPVIKDIPNIVIHYEEPYTFDYSKYINDIETPDNKLILNIEEPVGQKYTTVNGLNVTYNYPKSMFGEIILITLRVSDGEELAEDILQVSITDNHAPVLVKPLPEITLYEGESEANIFDLDEHFMDPDNDPLTYFFTAQYIAVNIFENNSVTITSPISWSGMETITFRAMDNNGAMAEGYTEVVVKEVNDPPQVSKIPDIYVHYDYDYNFNLSEYIMDPDNDTHELSLWTSNTNYISFHSSDNMIMTLNFPLSLLGEKIWVKLYVSDGIGIVTGTFWVYVSDNFPPMLNKDLNDIYFKEDTVITDAINLSEHFTDLDDPQLTFIYELNDRQNITILINRNGSVDFSSKQDWFGASYVKFKAKDSENAFIEKGINIVVIPENDAPIINTIPLQYGKVGERWVLDLKPYLSDVDNDLSELIVTVPEEYLDIITITGKQLTFHVDKPIDESLEIIISDGDKNITGTIDLTVKGKESTDIFIWFWSLLGIVILLILATIITVYRKRYGNFIVTDVFIIHKNGILIKYRGDTLRQDSDEDIISGMLTAVQAFISDSFAGSSKKENDDWDLNQLRMGGHEIMLEKGKYIFLAVIYEGEPGHRLHKLLSETVMKIESKYEIILDRWNGSFAFLKNIEDLITPLITPKKEPEQTPEDATKEVQQPLTEEHDIKQSQLSRNQFTQNTPQLQPAQQALEIPRLPPHQTSKEIIQVTPQLPPPEQPIKQTIQQSVQPATSDQSINTNINQ